MSEPVDVLARALAALVNSDSSQARAEIEAGYPFKPFSSERRSISQSRAMAVFLRDGFIDRYSGERLLFPGALRALSLQLPDAFPAHPNWKMAESHIAFWRHFPTVDHVVPVARRGAHDEGNFVTTSMLRNAAKSNWLIAELGWSLWDPGDLQAWDGLLGQTLHLAENSPSLMEDKYFASWCGAARRAQLANPRLHRSPLRGAAEPQQRWADERKR